MDTTLRDGEQTPGISFTVEDKVKIALLLEEFGVDLIEGGYPGASPKDMEFFKVMRSYSLTRSKLAAFTATRRPKTKAETDEGLNAVLDSGVEVAVVYGKAWDLHVVNVLKTSLEENINMIYDSVSYLRSHGLRVIFDAEHFYQGYLENRGYALEVLKAAMEAGADTLVLCDTNGGMLPEGVYKITKRVVKEFGSKVKVGAHMHDDCGCAVANTLEAVRAGARHVQGTINGLGERTGNADLVQVIPGIAFKLGFKVLKNENGLRRLKEVSRFVYEISGLKPDPRQPYVGEHAFRHKAGTHIDAVLKSPRAYEHVDPELVGSTRSFEITHLSGSSAIAFMASQLLGKELSKADSRVKNVLLKIKKMETEGYSFSEAQTMVSLLVLEEYCRRPQLLTFNERLAIVQNAIKAVSKQGELDFFETIVDAISSRLEDFNSSVKIKEVSVRKIKDSYRVTVVTNNGTFQRVSRDLFEALLKAVEDAVVYEMFERDKTKLCVDGEVVGEVYG
ncbi:MAG: citramalate synthase [Acidilobaceae archaeon]